jgi:hypothetical protein
MKSPRTTRLSRHLMTSKLRYLGNGMGAVYMDGYFLLLSSPYSSLLEHLTPLPPTQHYAF